MSRKSRQQSLRAAKERRQKQIAVGGGIVLAILLAIQVPRLLNRGGSAAPAATTTSATETASASGATAPPAGSVQPGAAGGVAAPAVSANTRLPNSDVAPHRLKSQLASFELFDSKDPFVQQIAESSPSAPPGPAGPTATPALPKPTSPAGGGSGTSSSRPSRGLARTGGAVIDVNGKTVTVSTGATFPKSNPTFRLVSLANGAALIGIADGAYASGAETVTLQSGKTLTLVNTGDGVRYELRLVSTS